MSRILRQYAGRLFSKLAGNPQNAPAVQQQCNQERAHKEPIAPESVGLKSCLHDFQQYQRRRQRDQPRRNDLSGSHEADAGPQNHSTPG